MSLSWIHRQSSKTVTNSLQTLKQLQNHPPPSKRFPSHLGAAGALPKAPGPKHHPAGGSTAGPAAADPALFLAYCSDFVITMSFHSQRKLLGGYFEQLSGRNPTEKRASRSAPQRHDDFGSRAPQPQTATYINTMSNILSASRSAKPLYFFPNVFCIHLVNKLSMLLIGAAHGEGEGNFLLRHRPQQRAALGSRRPASNDDIFYFGGFFFIYV